MVVSLWFVRWCALGGGANFVSPALHLVHMRHILTPRDRRIETRMV